MDIPVWGIGVIAVYSLLQIPAVLFVARYCEVDSEDLPTPPMRARWRDGNPQHSQDPRRPEESTPGSTSTDSDAPVPPPDPESPPEGPITSVGDPDPASPAPSATTNSADHLRCTNCGTRNDPSFARCRHCVTEL